jgi:outer membrane lipoprotein-sorting protein
MLKRCFIPVLLLGMAASLTGCLSTTRVVQKTQAPDVYRTASVETLEKQVSDVDAAINTLNAQVLITVSQGGSKEGKIKEYTSFGGYIFVQKPANLRVIMRLPVIGSEAMDMVGDGKTFTLLIPPYKKAFTGTNVVTKPSTNVLYNLRPPVFLDSLLIPGVGPDEYVSLTESTRVIQAETKHADAIEEPDYDLTVSKLTNGHILRTTRVLHISRLTMLPFQQDIYNDKGRVETQATYESYQKYGERDFPSVVTIKRPLDELSLKIVVTKLTFNETFDADQFDLKIPSDVVVQKMQ